MNWDYEYNSISNYYEEKNNEDCQYFSNTNPFFLEFNSFDNNEDNSFTINKNINDQLKTKCTLNQIENNSENNNEIEINEKSNITEVKILGRKRKNSNYKGVHTKYDEDNVIRKIRTILIKSLFNLINDFIFEVYNGKIGQGILRKELKNMNQNQTENVAENKKFLIKKLKDIFSVDLKRYTNYPSSHNKNLINKLLNEKDEEKRTKFEKIFNLTILDCLNHYKGIKYIKELEPLNSLINKKLAKFEDDKDYLNLLNYYIPKFEETIMERKSRKKKLIIKK